jgi:hypothetical protein
MAALVGGHRCSRHDGARRDPLPLPMVAHLLVLAAGGVSHYGAAVQGLWRAPL